MNFEYLTIAECKNNGAEKQPDTAFVVIDVIRAFTTACFAFEAGAEKIILVGGVDEAIAERALHTKSMAIGEVGGLKVQGYDLGNSPSEFQPLNLHGYTLVQRTSAGTQGMMAVRGAKTIVGASFVCAEATARLIRECSPSKVAFIVTGLLPDGKGDEDLACAEYLEKRIVCEEVDPEPYLVRVRKSMNAEILKTPPLNAPQDVFFCSDLDRFDFALPVKEINDRMVMKPVKFPGSKSK